MYSSFIFSGNVEQVEKEMKKCFVESYKRTDEDFLRQARSVYVHKFIFQK